jgi:hypothetical protein
VSHFRHTSDYSFPGLWENGWLETRVRSAASASK